MSETWSESFGKQRFDNYFQVVKNAKKKIKCVIDAATTTGTFIGDFISDRIQNVTASVDTGSDVSPTFFKSSSSSNHTVFEAITDEIVEEQVTYRIPLSSNESEKLNLNCTNSNICSSLHSTLDEPDNSHINKLSNTTTTDTFEFLFAPVNKVDLNKGLRKADSECKTSVNKRVNFFLTPEGRSPSFRDSKVFNSLVNRNVSSFVHANRDLHSGDLVNDGSFQSKSTNLISEGSMRHSSPNNGDVKPDSYLPSHAEGDTFDSQSDLIKVYPRDSETKTTRLQLFNYLHHEESYQSLFTSSETIKMKSVKTVKKVKPLKIYSKCHSPLLSHIKSNKQEAFVRNQSVRIVTLFHQTLTHLDD